MAGRVSPLINDGVAPTPAAKRARNEGTATFEEPAAACGASSFVEPAARHADGEAGSGGSIASAASSPTDVPRDRSDCGGSVGTGSPQQHGTPTVSLDGTSVGGGSPPHATSAVPPDGTSGGSPPKLPPTDASGGGGGGGSPPHMPPTVPIAVSGGGSLPHMPSTVPTAASGGGSGSGGGGTSGSPAHMPSAVPVPSAIIGGVKSGWGYARAALLSGPPPFGPPASNGGAGAAVGGVVKAESSPLAAAEFYVDKSHYIKELEAVGEFVALHRPRGWGKTTFLNMLDKYYDYENADVHLTGGDTELAHSFAILRFDLSDVVEAARTAAPDAATDHDKVVALHNAMDAVVLKSVEAFKERYSIPADALPAPIGHLGCLADVCEWATKRGTPVYVLVDECDAPLRRNIVEYRYTSRPEEARLARGAMRAFYGHIKALADSGSVSRIFLTGTFGV